MKQLILAPLKACLGEDYPRLRRRAVRLGHVWEGRLRNLGHRLTGAAPPALDAARLRRIQQGNRAACRGVDRWFTRELLSSSVCNYGMSPDLEHMLDAAIGGETTLTDLIAYHCADMPDLRYLEIGVSVGKNFVQVLGAAPSGRFTGFDIEDMNPLIARGLTEAAREEWPAVDPAAARRRSGAGFARTRPSSLRTLRDAAGRRTVRYLAGDVFDERSWQVLARETYNFIFSDALHTAPAIHYEYGMMKKHGLFAPERFTVVWDDLHFPGMRQAFREITDDLRRVHGADRTSRDLHLVHGWAGRHEGFRHLVGVFQKR